MDKSKNILHLIETNEPGGAETVLLNLATLLDKSRYNSIAGILGGGWLLKELQRKKVPVHILRFRHSLDWRLLKDIIKLIKTQKIDLVQSHMARMNFYGALAAKISGIPMIATVHGKIRDFENRRQVFAYKFVGRYGSKIVAVSHYLRDNLIKTAGINPGKIITIYNGISLNKFEINLDRARKRRELNIGLTTPIVTAIGDLRPVKGYEYFLQAASKVVKAVPATKFLIAGEGALRKELESQSQKLGLNGSVSFLGFRDDIPELLAISDVYVLPSLKEGFSISTIEAMAMSKPVVVTNSGGPPEIVIDSKTGFVVPPADAAALFSAMITLLKDKDTAYKMGEKGRKHVVENFSLANMVGRYEQLYETLLNVGARFTCPERS